MNTSPDPLTLFSRADLPPDLMAHLQSFAPRFLKFTELLKLRDDLIRKAAALFPLDYTIERKAECLAAIARRCRKPTDEISRLMLEAGRYAKLPKSPRHYRRIIEGL